MQAEQTAYGAKEREQGISGGLFVVSKSQPRRGDLVEVEGLCTEKHIRHFFEEGQTGLTMTMVAEHSLQVVGEQYPVMETDAFVAGMPQSKIYVEDPFVEEGRVDVMESGKQLDVRRGLDYWESLEGMYVRLRAPVVSQGLSHGSFYVYGKDMASNLNEQGGLTVVDTVAMERFASDSLGDKRTNSRRDKYTDSRRDKHTDSRRGSRTNSRRDKHTDSRRGSRRGIKDKAVLTRPPAGMHRGQTAFRASEQWTHSQSSCAYRHTACG